MPIFEINAFLIRLTGPPEGVVAIVTGDGRGVVTLTGEGVAEAVGDICGIPYI